MLKNLTIRTKLLIIMIMVTSIPLSITGYWMTKKSQIELSSTLREERYAPRVQKAAMIIDGQYFNVWEMLLEYLSSGSNYSNESIKGISDDVLKAIELFPEISVFAIYDENQNALIAAMNSSARNYFDKDSNLYENGMKELLEKSIDGKMYVTKPYFSKENESTFINIGIFVQKKFLFRMIINLEFLLDELASRISDLSGDSYLFIVDADGDYIFHTNPQTIKDSGNIRSIPELFQLLQAHAAGVFQYDNETGKTMLGSYASLNHTQWVVFIEEPESVAFLPIQIMIKNFSVSTLLTILAAGILSIFFARRLTHPIRALANAMNEVKDGHLEIHLTPSTGDEIGQLSVTFNEMIKGLRERLHLTKYVGEHTLSMIKSKANEVIHLGGARKNVTILFSDIRGFTAFSEKRDPEEVIAMLNRYLGFQAEIVKDNKGSIDKFVGDEMMALFVGDDSLARALKCAVAIQKRVKLEHKSDPVPIYIGIGINEGPVVMGNVGTAERMDHTVIGSHVNLAARLCGSAAAGEILIRKVLLDQQKDLYETGKIDLLRFKGFTEEMEIVSILSE